MFQILTRQSLLKFSNMSSLRDLLEIIKCFKISLVNRHSKLVNRFVGPTGLGGNNYFFQILIRHS